MNSKEEPILVLFPGFDSNCATWSKIVEYKHPKRGTSIEFLEKLKKLGFPIYFAEIPWHLKDDVHKYIVTLRNSIQNKYPNRKAILVGHSLGSLFCYLYAKNIRRK